MFYQMRCSFPVHVDKPLPFPRMQTAGLPIGVRVREMDAAALLRRSDPARARESRAAFPLA